MNKLPEGLVEHFKPYDYFVESRHSELSLIDGFTEVDIHIDQYMVTMDNYELDRLCNWINDRRKHVVGMRERLREFHENSEQV